MEKPDKLKQIIDFTPETLTEEQLILVNSILQGIRGDTDNPHEMAWELVARSDRFDEELRKRRKEAEI